MFIFAPKDYKMEKEPIVVVGNSRGGCIEIDKQDPDECCIILKQGDRYAALIGNIGLLMETRLEAGSELTRGRIVTLEQFEPYDPEDPEFLLKKRPDGTVCRKDGKAIYTHSYFTYKETEPDIIIEPDNI